MNTALLNAVTDFIRGGDNSDTALLNRVLHQDFRNTQNGFFEKEGVVIFSKTDYLKLIEDKVFGGKPRELTIISVDQIGKIAMVKAELKSSALSFISFISLVLDDHNEWKIIENFPHIATNHS